MQRCLDLLENNRKRVSFFCLAAYVLFSLSFLVRFRGCFAHDELYHLSASNEIFNAVSRYDRAPYLNLLVRFLSSVFGKNYYIYKSIPFVFGLLSVSIFLYLLYHLAEHTYSIICFIFLIGTHSLLIVNHMYIRMYVCDELVISIAALILYRLVNTTSAMNRILLHFFYFFNALILYLFQPSEQSALAVLGVSVLAWVLNYAGVKIISYLKKENYIFIFLILCGISMAAVTACVIFVRNGFLPIPHFLSKILVIRGSGEVSEPVFTGYFLTKGIFLTIGMIGYGYLLIKTEIANNMLGIYLLGLIPFLAYHVLYFDQRLFRSFSAYLPVLIFVTILWLDHFLVSRKSVCRMIAVTMLTALFSYPRATMHVKEFYTMPYIVGEVFFDDYGSLIRQVSQDISDGRKCFCIWANRHAEAVFSELDWEADLCLEDDINNRYQYSQLEFRELLEFYQDCQEPYVLVVGADCARKIDYWFTTEFMDNLRDNYPYVEYKQDAYLFYIN